MLGDYLLYMTILFVAYAVIGSIIAGLILFLSAKFLAKVETAKYGNSYLVSLLSSLGYYVFNVVLFLVLGIEGYANLIISLGVIGYTFLIFFVLSGIYVSIGKAIWKSTWLQSLLANLPWIVVSAILLSYFLSKMKVG